jgi:2-oxo-3-hexenedioate decarboxylase/2-keto-4-pentenoate hydratase
MKLEHAKFAASLLAEAWQIGTLLRELPEEARPRSAAEAYRIQDLLAEELGFPLGGWKIGCTSAAARKILKARGPFAGRVFATRMFESGVTLSATGYPMRGLEGEFAFRLKAPLPARKRPYRLGEVADAIGSLHLAIEVVDSRYADWLKVGTPCLIADQGSNGALVLGPAVPRWRTRKLETQAVRMDVNGKTVGQGTGADCLGHPLNALLWLANLMRRRGGMPAGAIISTGTCSGFHRAAPGDRARADFGKLGTVELAFTA